MSETPPGAPAGRDGSSGTGTRPGWFRRLMAQRASRTAAVAFLLTVALGTGGTSAYAYWNQSVSATISGTTGFSLPTPAAARCVTASPNRVEWAPLTGAEPEAKYLLTFQAGRRTVTYAIPMSYSSVAPSALTGLRDELGSTLANWVPLTVTVRTAIVTRTVTGPVQIGEDQISSDSEPSPALNMFYYTTLWGNYPCS